MSHRQCLTRLTTCGRSLLPHRLDGSLQRGNCPLCPIDQRLEFGISVLPRFEEAPIHLYRVVRWTKLLPQRTALRERLRVGTGMQ